jgi:hypothetical protein
MARQFKFQARINFNFADHSELTSMRTTAESFAAANGGTFDIITNENAANTSMSYYGRLSLNIPVTSRTEAANMMGTIDAALSSLPELVNVNGYELKYDFEEVEIAEPESTPPE